MNDNDLFLGAKAGNFQRARGLRKNSTGAELLLWNELRNSKLNGFKFRRQHPMNRFVADFYCHEAKLVIEIDGDIHQIAENKEHDDGRTYELKELGLKVIRFTNEEVLHSMKEVLNRISLEIQKQILSI